MVHMFGPQQPLDSCFCGCWINGDRIIKVFHISPLPGKHSKSYHSFRQLERPTCSGFKLMGDERRKMFFFPGNVILIVPIGSMYGIYLPTFVLMFMVNVGKYHIQESYEIY